jgi:NAD(P)-dependent dehydrogenase (short-subunit alcohol dehydrogenase family)
VGEAIVRSLYKLGAHVFFGDIDDAGASRLVEGLKSQNPSATNQLMSIKMDTRSYADNVALFKLAYDTMGRVDHAIANAAVTESLNWFSGELDLTSVEVAPPTTLVDVNLTGVLYFTRIAAVYLRQRDSNDQRDKSILLMGSIASFKEQAGLYIYQPTKHGVMGLFRATRKLFYNRDHIRINMVNPSHIDNIMGSSVHQLWLGQGVPANSVEQVAEHVLTLAACPTRPDGRVMTGLAVFVEGGKGWDTEEDLDKTDALWMGEEMSRNARKIEDALGVGVDWEPIK